MCLAFLLRNIGITVITTVIVLSLVLLMTGMTDLILKMVPFDYVQSNYIGYASFAPRGVNTIGLYLKYGFYFLNYAIMCLFSKKKDDLLYSKINKLIGFILMAGALLYMSEESAKRLLITIDMMIPIIYFDAFEIIKEKKGYLICLVVVLIIYFVLIINSNALRGNFGL